ncbi:MAG: ATP-binding cassette domain-containing protein [Candidatus Aenigmarchaeota archaeon]|nr:ATP-binding cassette domain-containing protein [Candidatus Aenigmarchaeota archaeon]
MAAIELVNLTKKFNGFAAVDGITLTIQEGELFGLLGPNGAGKTTTISMLATMLKPTTGSATVNGVSIAQEDAVRKSIGIVFQDPSLDDELTGEENLDFHGRLYHMPKTVREQRMQEVLRLVELEDKARQQVKTYSGGMKRRLEIARGLMHRPKILFLDEPTLGMDPQTRRSIWEYTQKLNKQEKVTIVLTTHYMEEADYLCGRIAIIDKGKIIALDTPANLKNSMGGDIVMLETPDAEKLKGVLTPAWIKGMKLLDGTLSVTVSNGETAVPKILDIARLHGIAIRAVSLKKPNLEDVFIHYTGRTIREEEASAVDTMRLRMKMGWRR